jgi:hypothetical protein
MILLSKKIEDIRFFIPLYISKNGMLILNPIIYKKGMKLKMRNKRCPFCPMMFDDKHKFCHHISNVHNDQVPDDAEPLEFAYSLLVNKPIGRVCTVCRKNKVNFNQSSLKYDRLCDNPKCKEEYVKLVKGRMKDKYGKEHLLDTAEQQRKMIYNHPLAKDYKWDDEHTFRVIGSYEYNFLDYLKSIGWSPNDIIAPSPHDYYYTWKDGTKHLYIPDFYIPSLSLEVEIKESDNHHPRMEHSREIEYLKDAMMAKNAKQTAINYIKIVDKDYNDFFRDYVKSDNNQPE